MSSPTQAAAEAVGTIDWKVVAAAVATFLATFVTIVWGWVQGRKKVEAQIKPKEGADVPLVAGMVMDNLTVRESTMVSKEVRDQLLILNHALMSHTRNLEEVAGLLEDLVKELRERR